MELHTFNSRIEVAGLRYIAHFNVVEIRIGGRDWGLTIPGSRLQDLITIFPEHNWEDGCFIESLKGEYLRVVEDGFKIVKLMHITEPLEYKV